MNTFAAGVVSMARSCKAALELIRQGKATLDETDRWLDDVIKTDLPYTHTRAKLCFGVRYGFARLIPFRLREPGFWRRLLSFLTLKH